MKSLKKYRDHFLDLKFERKLEFFRRKKFLELVSEFQYNSVLEVGCGIDSVCNYLDKNVSCTIVEPIEEFCDIAKKNLKNKNLKIKWDTTKPTGDKKRVLNIKRAKKYLKFKPKIVLDKGIKKTINWYLNNSDVGFNLGRSYDKEYK